MSIAYTRRIRNLRILKKYKTIKFEWLMLTDVPLKYLKIFGYVQTPNQNLWVKQ